MSNNIIIDPLGNIYSRPDVGPQLPINLEQKQTYYQEEPVKECIECPEPDYCNHCMDEDVCHPRKKINFIGFDLNSPIFWAYFIIILITGIILYYIHSINDISTINIQSNQYFINWIVSFLIFLWAGYNGYMKSAPDYRRQNLLNIALAINLILSVMWAIVYFQLNQPFEAFWIMAILIFVIIWWVYLLWDVDRLSAYFMLIHLAFVIYYAYLNYQAAQNFNPLP